MTIAVHLMLVMSPTCEHRGRQESKNCPWEGRKRNGQILEIAGSSLLAKQFVINLHVKTDGEPWGGGFAKTLCRGIFRTTVFCYYAGKMLLLTLPMTALSLTHKTGAQKLGLHHLGQRKFFPLVFRA